MKNNFLILLCSSLFISCFSQTSRDVFFKSYTPPLIKEKLNEAKVIKDIIPNCPSHWNGIIDIVSINILAVCNGRDLTSENSNENLTQAQKDLLLNADLGSNISVKIKFKWKDTKSVIGDYGKILNMNEFRVAVVPAIEAEFPGGYKQIAEYLNENIFKKIPETGLTPKQILSVKVIFTIDENGNVVNAKIPFATNPAIDKLLLEAITKMPKWKPAQNSKGLKVKQEFSYSIGQGGC